MILLFQVNTFDLYFLVSKLVRLNLKVYLLTSLLEIAALFYFRQTKFYLYINIKEGDSCVYQHNKPIRGSSSSQPDIWRSDKPT